MVFNNARGVLHIQLGGTSRLSRRAFVPLALLLSCFLEWWKNFLGNDEKMDRCAKSSLSAVHCKDLFTVLSTPAFEIGIEVKKGKQTGKRSRFLCLISLVGEKKRLLKIHMTSAKPCDVQMMVLSYLLSKVVA